MNVTHKREISLVARKSLGTGLAAILRILYAAEYILVARRFLLRSVLRATPAVRMKSKLSIRFTWRYVYISVLYFTFNRAMYVKWLFCE